MKYARSTEKKGETHLLPNDAAWPTLLMGSRGIADTVEMSLKAETHLLTPTTPAKPELLMGRSGKAGTVETGLIIQREISANY